MLYSGHQNSQCSYSPSLTLFQPGALRGRCHLIGPSVIQQWKVSSGAACTVSTSEDLGAGLADQQGSDSWGGSVRFPAATVNFPPALSKHSLAPSAFFPRTILFTSRAGILDKEGFLLKL